MSEKKKVAAESMMRMVITSMYYLVKWERLSAEGACDTVGGAEFFRVFSEWIDADRPSDVEEFIHYHANRPAE